MKKFIYCLVFLLGSCATQSAKVPLSIDLITVDKNDEPIDAVCTIHSSSSKFETLSPNKFIFMTECSAINVLCKTDKLTGQYGVVYDNNLTTENFVVNTGIGYLFDLAVDAITPMGQFLNFVDISEDDCESINQKIKVVLE